MSESGKPLTPERIIVRAARMIRTDSTPNIREYQWGTEESDDPSSPLESPAARLYQWGTQPAEEPGGARTPRLYGWGDIPSGVPAYAVFQPSGKPALPSIVFESTGVSETDTLERGGLIEQDFSISVRANTYEDVIDVTDKFYSSLRRVAGPRYRGMSGQFNDSYAPTLGYRERTFSITLRR